MYESINKIQWEVCKGIFVWDRMINCSARVTPSESLSQGHVLQGWNCALMAPTASLFYVNKKYLYFWASLLQFDGALLHRYRPHLCSASDLRHVVGIFNHPHKSLYYYRLPYRIYNFSKHCSVTWKSMVDVHRSFYASFVPFLNLPFQRHSIHFSPGSREWLWRGSLNNCNHSDYLVHLEILCLLNQMPRLLFDSGD